MVLLRENTSNDGESRRTTQTTNMWASSWTIGKLDTATNWLVEEYCMIRVPMLLKGEEKEVEGAFAVCWDLPVPCWDIHSVGMHSFSLPLLTLL